MAAKPPKPPGNFLKSLLNQHNNNNNNNNNNNKNQKQQNNEDDNIKEVKNGEKNLIKSISSTIASNSVDNNTTAKKANCNCSNISIMHLFHEMKQEFPTIPDTIVAQCVNENCHQRENCIQMLKNELELNPVPAQSYPAKVLHPQNHNHNFQNSINVTTTTPTPTPTPPIVSIQKPPLQQKPLLVQQKPPLKPIKPTRTAPLQPPHQLQNNNNNNGTKSNSPITQQTTKPLDGKDFANIENHIGGGAEALISLNETPLTKQSIIDTTTNTTDNVNVNSTTFEVSNDKKDCGSIGDSSGDGENTERILPRQRPTTLNLNTQLQKQQQQQRQRLNIQLQQRFQEQRNRQTQNLVSTTKPIRKAPLPPIAPKPSQFQLSHTNINNAHLDNHTTTSPPSESEISLSVSLSTPSPTSSSSPNTTTHHPFGKPTQATSINQQHLQTKSPIRHRSVITLQPEPPYTRDFLFTPASLPYPSSTPTSPSLAASSGQTTKPLVATNSSSSANSSPTTSVAGSQKSFTSVNLTLRPPVSPNDPSAALQPSTIDITAGPGFSGASGGGKSLHYSSTSYDARLGYQQNFQITVTDECGIFSASRIRPHQHQQHLCLNQVNITKDNQNYDNSENEIATNNDNQYLNSFLNPKQQQQQQQKYQHQQFHNNNVVASQQNIQNSIKSPQSIGAANTSTGRGGFPSEYITGNQMCLPPQQAVDASTQEILQRQKKKRDKLAAALREYKKRLGNVEQEINLLTGTIPTEGLSERLDDEITKLRRDCQDMLRSSTTFTQPPSQQELAINYQPYQQMSPQQQPQPFPRQRITRPPPRPPPPRQTSLDIIQHHSQTSTPHTPPAVSLPDLNVHSRLQQQHLQHQQLNHTSPPYYYQQSVPANVNFSNNNNELYTDHHSNYINNQDLVVDDGDDYDDEYEEVIEPWECNMCTFRNHPQLNICETCENVRIIPGRLTNLSRALATSNHTNIAASAAAVSNATATNSTPTSNVSSTLDLLRAADSTNAINNSSSRNGLNAANGNLEHDTNLAQQQLQHFALHI